MGHRFIFAYLLFIYASPLLASDELRLAQGDDDAGQGPAPEVTWSSPTNGQVLRSGDTLVGAWSSEDAIKSPSFSLCLTSSDPADQSDGDGDDASCGELISPELTQMDSGFSTMTLTVPNVSAPGNYLLRMVDEDSNEFDSPAFVLAPQLSEDAPTAPAVALPASSAIVLSTISRTQPAASSSEMTSGPSSSTTAEIVTATTSTSTSTPTPTPTATLTTPTLVPTAVNLRAHPRPSTLALAIPLSLIGATIFAALLLCCAKWRRAAKKRARSPEGYTCDEKAYPFGGYGPQPALGPSQDLEKAVSRLSAVAQIRSSRMSGSFIHPQLSMLGSRAGSDLSDKYTTQRDRSRRTPRVRDDSSFAGSTPYPSRLMVNRSLSNVPSFESFPVDYADYSQPIASAQQPTTRRARSSGAAQTPFVQRQVYAPPSIASRKRQEEQDYETTSSIVDSYMQDSPRTPDSATVAELPRIVYKPRSRPQSGDSLAFRLQRHGRDVEGQYSGSDVYRIVSQRVHPRF